MLLVGCQKDYYLEDLQLAEQQVENLTNFSNNLQDDIAALEEDKDSLSTTILQLEQTILDLQVTIAELKTMNSILTDGLEISQERVEFLEGELERTLQRLQESLELIAEYEEQVAALLSNIDNLNAEIASLNSQNSNQATRIAELEATIQGYESEIASLQGTINTVAGRLIVQENAVRIIQQQLDDALAAAAAVVPGIPKDIIENLRDKGVERVSHLIVGINMYESGIALVDITPTSIAAVISEAGYDPSTYRNANADRTIMDYIAPNDFKLSSTFLGINSENFSTFSAAAENLNLPGLPNVESDFDIYIIETIYTGTNKFSGDGANYNSYLAEDPAHRAELLRLAIKYGLVKVVFEDQDGNVISYNGQTEFIPNEQGEFIGPRQHIGNEFSYIDLTGSPDWVLGFIIYEYNQTDIALKARASVRRVGGTSGQSGSGERVGRRRVTAKN